MKYRSSSKYPLMILLFIFFYLAMVPYTAAESDTMKARCEKAITQDINKADVRESIISLLAEIKANEELYLKSSLYTDIRDYYERLHVKLADYFFNRKNFEPAFNSYVEAHKYSVQGYKKKIAQCKEKIIEKREITKLMRNGIYYYNKEEYYSAQHYFQNVLDLDPGEANALKYMKRIADWQEVREITPTAYIRFKKDHGDSLILPGFKKKLDRKYENLLPPEHYLEFLTGRNSRGYWEAVLNGHLMVYIPGTSSGTGGFFVDKYEVSFAQLENVKEFKKKRKKSKIPLFRELTSEHPAVVTFEEAELYCKIKGFRLLTEQEWELAAGKEKGYIYPWGDMEADAGEVYRANYESFNDGSQFIAPVKSYEKDDCISPFGIVNLAGNVWEWVQGKICKGGGFLSGKEYLKISASSGNECESCVGLRCVKDVKK